MSVLDGRTPGTAVLSDRYELGQAVGHGGMADVYRGRDLVLGRAVAVKVLREVTADPVARDRFVAEARTLAGLSHRGLVTVLDAGVDGRRPYLVMELVEGPTLAEACRPTGLDARRVASIGAQVADALAYVHGRGIVHRDVKPGNVLLGADGRALLADFGIAKLTAGAAALTATGATVGTAAYLAPEQLRGGPVGPGSDVYSLGLVLLEALTGRPAYPGVALEAAMARLSRPPALPAGLPAALAALLRRMVALRPEDRPALPEVASVLRAVAAGTGVTRAGAAGTGEARAGAARTGEARAGAAGTGEARAGAAGTGTARAGADATVRLAPGPGVRPSGTEDRGAGGGGTAVLPQPVADRGPAPVGPAPAHRPTSRRRLVLAVGLPVLVALLVLAGVLLGTRDQASEQPRIPPNLPAEISEDLRELHEAVDG